MRDGCPRHAAVTVDVYRVAAVLPVQSSPRPARVGASRCRSVRWRVQARFLFATAVAVVLLLPSELSLAAVPPGGSLDQPIRVKSAKMIRQLQGEEKPAPETGGPQAKSPRKRSNLLAPSRVRVTDQAGGRPTVSWMVPRQTTGVVRYRLYRDGSYVASTSASHFRFSAVPCGARQRLGVRAIAANGKRSREATIRYRRICTKHGTAPEVVPTPASPLRPRSTAWVFSGSGSRTSSRHPAPTQHRRSSSHR